MNENIKAMAIDRALAHYLADFENKQRIADDLSTDFLEGLSTAQLPMARTTAVGQMR